MIHFEQFAARFSKFVQKRFDPLLPIEGLGDRGGG